LHVVFTDAPARASAGHAANIHTNFARQTTHVRRRRYRIAVCAGNLTQLHGHAERRYRDLRLIGWQRLFFSFALGAHGQLEREPCRLLSGDVFHRFVPASRFHLGDYTALQRKDDLTNLDLLTLFYFDLSHYAVDRGRNFDPGVVGFEIA